MNTRLNQSEARNQLIDNVCITSQKVTIAKAYILKNFDTDTKKTTSNFHTNWDGTPTCVSGL